MDKARVLDQFPLKYVEVSATAEVRRQLLMRMQVNDPSPVDVTGIREVDNFSRLINGPRKINRFRFDHPLTI